MKTNKPQKNPTTIAGEILSAQKRYRRELEVLQTLLARELEALSEETSDRFEHSDAIVGVSQQVAAIAIELKVLEKLRTWQVER